MKTIYKDETIYKMSGKFIVHFLAFFAPEHDRLGLDAVPVAYASSIEWASYRRGKKYHNKRFGGGIAFPSLQAAWDAIDAAPRNKQTSTVEA